MILRHMTYWIAYNYTLTQASFVMLLVTASFHRTRVRREYGTYEIQLKYKL